MNPRFERVGGMETLTTTICQKCHLPVASSTSPQVLECAERAHRCPDQPDDWTHALKLRWGVPRLAQR